MTGWSLGWKTILGAALVAAGQLLHNPADPANIAQAIGIFLGGIGIRAAVSK